MSNDAEIKNSDYYIDLLEKLITEEPTQKIVNEINLYKKVDLHPNVLKFHGITKIETDLIHHIDNYSLVLEYADSADYDLAHEIMDGRRENDVKGTPTEYINLYRECWKNEHNERPDIHKVVSTLRAIISHEQKDNNLLETYNSDANSSEEIIDTNHDLILDDISSMNLSYVDDSRSNSSLQDQITVKSSINCPENNSTESLFDDIINIIIDKIIKKHNKSFTFEQIKQFINQQISQLNQPSSGNQ
ncbi:unnamed protein product [Rhizophagus irregularis]|nr:unnamed protein product [Rhizophagus irregularis]